MALLISVLFVVLFLDTSFKSSVINQITRRYCYHPIFYSIYPLFNITCFVKKGKEEG